MTARDDVLLRRPQLAARLHVGAGKIRAFERAGMPVVTTGDSRTRYYQMPAVRKWLGEQFSPEAIARPIVAELHRMAEQALAEGRKL